MTATMTVASGVSERAGGWTRLGLWAGPAAAAVFTASVIGFAALRTDGYTHATKAVSELGAIGAPHALAFNLLGFILPGLLIMVFAAALKSAAGGRWFGPLLLALSGAAMAAAGAFPADMEHREVFTTVAHLAAAMMSGFLWALALPALGGLLKRDLGLRLWGLITPGFILFLIANIGWQVAFSAELHSTPGYGQRLGFGGYMLWLAVTGWLAARKVSRSKA